MKTFVVHQSVLAKSPVFAAMCKQPFREANEQHINLPDDDPETMGRVISWMYFEEFKSGTDEEWNAMSTFEKLKIRGMALIVAEKYGLDKLKKLMMSKLRPVDAHRETQPCRLLQLDSDKESNSKFASALFQTAQMVYEYIPESETAFRTFFVETAWLLFAKSHDAEVPQMKEELEELAESGGHFAKDCVKISRELHVKMAELHKEPVKAKVKKRKADDLPLQPKRCKVANQPGV